MWLCDIDDISKRISIKLLLLYILYKAGTCFSCNFPARFIFPRFIASICPGYAGYRLSIFMLTLKLLISSSTASNLTVHQIWHFVQQFIYILQIYYSVTYACACWIFQWVGWTGTVYYLCMISSPLLFHKIIFQQALMDLDSLLGRWQNDFVNWTEAIYLGQLLWFFELGMIDVEIKFSGHVKLCGFIFNTINSTIQHKYDDIWTPNIVQFIEPQHQLDKYYWFSFRDTNYIS